MRLGKAHCSEPHHGIDLAEASAQATSIALIATPHTSPRRPVYSRPNMDPRDQKALDDIAEYGCHVIHVMEDDEGPGFSYSVGIERSSAAPEVVVIGLKRSLAHSIVNEYNRRVRAGERFEVGRRYGGFIEGFELQVVAVAKAHYRAYFGWALGLYEGSDFRVVQLIYPTTDGVWPWDAHAAEWFRAHQPILGDTDASHLTD
jgi:hypothetical protein